MQVQRSSLAEQAAGLLLERIRAGEWALGEKLPGETTLAPQLGVGRSTIREAIRHLAARGVLITRQGAGVFLAALELAEDWDDVLRRADIIEVIEARVAIESEGAALAAARRTRTDLQEIRSALAGRLGHGDDLEALVDADLAFHRAVVAAGHNAILIELFDGFVPRLREAMVTMLSRTPQVRETTEDSDHDAHVLLTEAIEAGDAPRAGLLSRAHLEELKANQS